MGRRIDDEPKPGYLPILFFTSTTRMGIVIGSKAVFSLCEPLVNKGIFLCPFSICYTVHNTW